MDNIVSFIHLAFVAFITLFAPVNPIGTAFIVNPLLTGLDRRRRVKAAKKVAFFCLCISIVSVLAGSWILKLFGLSLPVVQVAGGAVICNMGWQILTAKTERKRPIDRNAAPEDQLKETEELLFYPIAFPMLTGAGTISVLLTLSVSNADGDMSQYMRNMAALLVGVVLMSILIFICIANTDLLFRRIGARGQQAVNKISAFIILCVGLQILWEGVKHLFHLH